MYAIKKKNKGNTFNTFSERAQNNVSGFRLNFSLGRQNNATQRTTSRRHTDAFKIKLYYVSRTVQVRLHTVQTHLSAPPNLLIQKTFILFPLRRKRKWGVGGLKEEEEEKKVEQT